MGNLGFTKKQTKEEKIDNNSKYNLTIWEIKSSSSKDESLKKYFTREENILLSFDYKEYKLQVTQNTPLGEIKSQLKIDYNISFDEYSLYSRYGDLSNRSDSDLLNSIYTRYSNDDLYLYPKNELYEINIERNSGEYLKLKIHDSMKMNRILDFIISKYFIYSKYSSYYLIINGNKINDNKIAAFYDLKNIKTILLHEK